MVWILSPVRLPISPPRLLSQNLSNSSRSETFVSNIHSPHSAILRMGFLPHRSLGEGGSPPRLCWKDQLFPISVYLEPQVIQGSHLPSIRLNSPSSSADWQAGSNRCLSSSQEIDCYRHQTQKDSVFRFLRAFPS